MTVRAAERGGMYINYVMRGLHYECYGAAFVPARGARTGPVTWVLYERGDVDVPSDMEGVAWVWAVFLTMIGV